MLPGKNAAGEGDDLFDKLLRWNLVGIPTLVVRKDCLTRVGALDERLPRLIDWDLALRLAREYPVLFCREPLLLSYHTESSITENVDAYIESVALILSKYAEDYKGRWWLVVNHYLFNARYLARNRRYGRALEYSSSLGSRCKVAYGEVIIHGEKASISCGAQRQRGGPDGR